MVGNLGFGHDIEHKRLEEDNLGLKHLPQGAWTHGSKEAKNNS